MYTVYAAIHLTQTTKMAASALDFLGDAVVFPSAIEPESTTDGKHATATPSGRAETPGKGPTFEGYTAEQKAATAEKRSVPVSGPRLAHSYLMGGGGGASRFAATGATPTALEYQLFQWIQTTCGGLGIPTALSLAQRASTRPRGHHTGLLEAPVLNAEQSRIQLDQHLKNWVKNALPVSSSTRLAADGSNLNLVYKQYCLSEGVPELAAAIQHVFADFQRSRSYRMVTLSQLMFNEPVFQPAALFTEGVQARVEYARITSGHRATRNHLLITGARTRIALITGAIVHGPC